MNISPISFGRAIQVNTTPEVAKMISDAANTKQSITELQRFSKKVFDDTNIHKAKVVVIEPNEVYIFSGEEAKIQSEVSSDLRKKVKSNNELVKMIPLREVREKRQHQAKVENCRALHYAIYKMRSLVENGVNGNPLSSLEISPRIVKSKYFGEYLEIAKASYTSNRNETQESLEYKA